jgi:hypothetical protein
MKRVLLRCSACVALTLGIMVALEIGSGATTTPTYPTPAAAALSPTNPVPPVDIGGGPMSSASQCPSSPPNIPSGATVSDPSLNPATSPLTSVISGQTISLAGHCTWSVSFANASSPEASPDQTPVITYEFAGNLYSPIDQAEPASAENLYGQACYDFVEGGNYYVAFSQVQNYTGYCNTNQNCVYVYCVSTSEVEAVNHNVVQNGNVCDTTTFNEWCDPISTEPGSVVLWNWEACVQDPVGNNQSYVCTYADLSPFY